MRASVHKNDPGYENYITSLGSGGLEVYCDGKLIFGAITADEEEGFVVAYCLDTDGRRFIDGYGDVAEIVHRGLVKISPKGLWANNGCG